MSNQSMVMMLVVVGFYVGGFMFLLNKAFNKKETN